MSSTIPTNPMTPVTRTTTSSGTDPRGAPPPSRAKLASVAVMRRAIFLEAAKALVVAEWPHGLCKRIPVAKGTVVLLMQERPKE